MWVKKEPGTRKTSSGGAEGEKTGLFQAKVRRTVWVLVVLQFSGGVWKHGLSATWVAPLFLASLLLYCHWLCTLVSIAAHFLRINVDFALCKESPGSRALIHEIATVSSWARVAADVQIPLTCLLFFFYSAILHSSSATAATPPCEISCVV